MATFKGKSAVDAGYPALPAGISYRSTSRTMRDWGDGSATPPQSVPRTPYTFWDGTKIPGGVHALSVDAVRALDEIFKKHAYRLDAKKDDWAWNRRKIAGTNSWSSHSWSAALDINAATNPYRYTFISDMPPAMIYEIELLKTTNGVPVWRWGGRFRYYKNGRLRGKADAMHFQIACSPSDLATGIVKHGPEEETDNMLKPHLMALLNHSFTDEEKIRAYYQDILKRQPDTAGRNYWVGLLSSGEYTDEEVYEAFRLSKEASKK